MKVRCAHDRMVSLSDLKPHPKNRNKHPPDQIARLAQILHYQGWRYPIKVSSLSKLPPGGSFIAWDKRNENLDAVLGNTSEFCWAHPPVRRMTARILWSGHHGMQGDDSKTRVHPTQKPAALAEWFFERWGKDRSNILDLYLGSGSTLIACEKTNRKCFGMEIDPHYVSVILDRWEKFSGKKAVREDGVEWATIKADAAK